MAKLRLSDLSLKGKRVLMRVDYNVPLNDDGSIADDSRIRASLPSIQYVLDQGASLILMSHLGRPKKRNERESLAPCAKRLAMLLQRPVEFVSDCVGPEVEKRAARLKPGEVLLLENLRFHPGEEAGEAKFVESLARLGDVYVNDAFGTAHRAHASTAHIAKYFAGRAAMGFLIEKEIEHLDPLLHNPKRPFYAVIGGAKVSSKAGVIRNLAVKLDGLFIGGGMAFPFLKAKGVSIGCSLCEESDVPVAKEILSLAASRSLKLWLPADNVAAREGAEPQVFAGGIPEGWEGMDVGPETVRAWAKALPAAATVFWNGPLGVFEKPPFDRGTKAIAEVLAGMSKATVVVGGGDSVAAIQQWGLQKKFSHLSTGGGASLEYLEFGHLPGIDVLSDK